MKEALGIRSGAALLLLFLGSSATPRAQAWDHVSTEYPAGPAGDFVPQSITPPDSTGYWAFGRQAAFEPAFAHYGTDGIASPVRYPHNAVDAFVNSIVSNPVVLSDGGFAVEYMMNNTLSYFEFDCYLQRYDRAGHFRWQALMDVSAGVTPVACGGHLGVDGTDGIWANNIRYGPDGAATPMTPALPPSNFPDIVPDPTGSDFYRVSDNSIVKYDRSGTKKWEWQSTVSGARLTKLVVSTSGNLFGFGTADQHAYGVSLTTGGSLRWEEALSTTSASSIFNVASTSTDDSFLAVGAADGTVHLIKVNADGALGWEKLLPPDSPCNVQSGTAVAAPNDDALFLHAPSNYCNQTSRLYRFKPDGTQIYVLPVTADAFEIREEQLRSLADGSTLLVLQSGGFIHVAADGSALASPATTQLVEGAFYPLEVALADDGSSYFLTQREPAAYVVRHFASDGMLSWQRSNSGFRASATLATARDRMCIIGAVASDNNGSPGDLHVVCLSANDGAILWDTALTQNTAADSTPGALAARTLASGAVVLAYRIGPSVHITSLTPDGGIAHDTALSVPESSRLSAAINSAGQSAVVWLDASGRNSGFASVTPDGTAFTAAIPVNPLIYHDLVELEVNDDGSVLLFANVFAPPAGAVYLYAYLLDAHGARIWTSPAIVTDIGSAQTLPTYFDASTLFGSPGKMFASVRGGSRIVTLAMADGGIAWQTDMPIANVYPLDPLSRVLSTLTPSAGGQDLIATATYVGKIRLTRIDAATGAIKRDRFEACGTDFCGLDATGIGSDGALRVAADTLDGNAGLAAHVYTIAHPLAEAVPVRIGQAGLDGAWYAEYSGGQGFTFDYIASARTIFMPWFTFAQDGANVPSSLAWYTLQSGALATLATSADLAIAVSNAGAFNSGSVPGTQVGSAHLSFTDCSHGSLYYQFTGANNGAGGLISLTRLTPSTDPCVLADNSIEPAQDTNPPANGFDGRQSGSWFDPAAGGQGLEMTVIPAGNGSAGVVFIPWFTFDPAGHSDDPMSQHWFTLQGGLSTAAGGKVDLPIYRIIGGAFDLTPTSNFAQVGHATLTMSGCDTAQLDYQFDSSEVAHAFSGLSGSAHLVKIGGCTAP